MGQLPLRVLSNIPNLEKYPVTGLAIAHRFVGRRPGLLSAFRIFLASFRYDVLVLDGNGRFFWLLCLLRWLWRFGGCRLVSVDVMLVQPATRRQRLAAWFHRRLLGRVDHFIHYFRDLEGYRRFFGIGPDRSSYVPFKVNHWERLPPPGELSPDGDYVFTGGRSLRDLDTFVEAMRRAGVPGLLLYHDPARMRANGTPLRLDGLPPNVRAVEDDGSRESWFRHLRGARLVVVTTLPSSIRAIGVSTYLVAMGLKKCVIITDGPATRGILTEEAIVVPAADPVALAEAIRKAWRDDALRERTAAAGRRYAEKVGGEARLYGDILRTCARVAGVPVAETEREACPADQEPAALR